MESVDANRHSVLLMSSYLQTNDYAGGLGVTWNRPLRLTDNWRAITGGVPAVVTKIIVSPVFAENTLEVDVWPPARPCASARLSTTREDQGQNAAWSGLTVASETPLPADGNPNHLHVTFARNQPFALQFGGDGDVQNPDSNLTFFTAYMAWWAADSITCPSPGGPGTGPMPLPGGCRSACSTANDARATTWALAAALLVLASIVVRRLRRAG